MQAVVAEFRKTRVYRWGKVVSSVAGVAFAVVGFAGFFDDIATWGLWIAGVKSGYVYGALYGTLLVVSLSVLVAEAWPTSRRGEYPATVMPAQVRSATPAPATVYVPIASSTGPATSEPESLPPGSAHSTASHAMGDADSRKLSDRLQKQLDEGARLRRGIPVVAGVSIVARAETTEADFDMWVKRTRRILRNADAELEAEFNYKPGKAYLA